MALDVSDAYFHFSLVYMLVSPMWNYTETAVMIAGLQVLVSNVHQMVICAVTHPSSLPCHGLYVTIIGRSFNDLGGNRCALPSLEESGGKNHCVGRGAPCV